MRRRVRVQLLSIRDEIIDADDFAFTVKALQHYDNRLPIHTLIRAAHALYAEDVNSARRVDDAF
jgi:hypothetical protein